MATKLLRPSHQLPLSRLLNPIRTYAAPSLRQQQPSLSPPTSHLFHTTTPRPILPALPQKISGTVNDPAPIPHSSPIHGSYHWTMERAVSAALIPLCIAPFAGGSLNPLMDGVLAGMVLVHSHIGFQSIIIDYIPNMRLPKVRKAFMWLLNLATAVVGIGLYEFETNDVGLTEAIKRLWRA